MTNLTEAQRELLARGSRRARRRDRRAADAKTASALIKQGLVIALPVAGGASRILITEAGRAALAEPGADGSASGGDTIGCVRCRAPSAAVETDARPLPTGRPKPRSRRVTPGKLGRWSHC